MFGDGAFLLENTLLLPERSHNGNAGLELAALTTPTGVFSASVQTGIRAVEDLILLITASSTQQYVNVGHARALALSGSLDWTSPGSWVSFSGNGSWADYRNHSSTGDFARFAGDRLPNRPGLQANGTATFRLRDLITDGDALTFDWTTRFVNHFFTSWESAGRLSTKNGVPSQVLHFAAVTFRIAADGNTFTAALAFNNLTDANAFDVFGVQKPGRNLMARVSLDL